MMSHHLHRWRAGCGGAVIAGLSLLACTLPGWAQTAAPAARPPVPLSPEDALADEIDFCDVSRIVLSPDGRRIAFTLVRPGRRGGGSGLDGRAQGADIWVLDLTAAGAKSVDLTQGQGTNTTPAWSPDGTRIAFYSDRDGERRLWVVDTATGAIRRVSDIPVRPLVGDQNPPVWTPDGRGILVPVGSENSGRAEAAARPAVRAVRAGEPAAPKSARPAADASVRVLVSPRPPATPGKRASAVLGVRQFTNDLALINLATGDVRRIARGLVYLCWTAVSPRGDQVAFTSIGSAKPGGAAIYYDLSVAPLPDSGTAAAAAAAAAADTVRRIAPNLPLGSPFAVSWSPDGRTLAYVDGGSNPLVTGRGDVFVVPADGAAPPRKLAAVSHPNFGRFGFFGRGPIWDADGSHLYLTPRDGSGLWRVSTADPADAKQIAQIPGHELLDILPPVGSNRVLPAGSENRLFVATRDEKSYAEGFYAVDLASGHAAPVHEAKEVLRSFNSGQNEPFLARCTPDGRIVYAAESAQAPQDLWSVDTHTRAVQRLTDLNPRFDRYTFGERRLLDYTGPDHKRLRAALLLPAGYQPGTRYPMVVFPYGRARSELLYRFYGQGVDAMDLFTTRGYAVLLPDVYLRRESALEDYAGSVLPAVDAAIHAGVADPDRLGMMGESWGGYGVYCLLVQTNRFRAAVARSGFADRFATFNTMGDDGSDRASAENSFVGEGLGVTPYQDRARFIRESPIFFLDRVQTPLLIVEGTENRWWTEQNDHVFVSLRSLGKTAVYARYPGEGHAEMDWTYAHQLDYLNRIIAWFDGYLKGSEDGRRTEPGSPSANPQVSTAGH